jgi:hypothetical protein
MLVLPGCGSYCGDDGFVWLQAGQPACAQVSAETEAASTEAASTEADSTALTATVPTTGPTTTTEPTGGMYCKDVDGDGFGDPGMCSDDMSPGSVPNDDDCADNNASAYPGAAENESDTVCMEDADEDGWGDDMPSEGVDPGADCDDESSSTFPDAAIDLPGVCAQDSDGDGHGDGSPDDPDVPAGGDCADEDPDTFPGAAPSDSAEACMTDADDDDYGDIHPAPGVVPGTDCDDADGLVHADCVMCTAGGVNCVEDDLHVCNDVGNSEEVTSCAFGCDDDGKMCWDPLEVAAGDSLCIDLGEVVQLNAAASGGDGMYIFSWTPLDTLDDASKQDPLASPLGPTTYAVDISDGEGNMASDKVSVYLKGQVLNLSPELCTTHDFPYESDPATQWVWNDQAKELCQTVNGRGSALFCGWELEHATVTGTFSVKTAEDDDWTGFMWGLQDTSHFYIFTWKQLGQDFSKCGGALPGGMQVKVVDVQDVDQDPLTCADLHLPADTANSRLLVGVDEFTTAGWKDNTDYVFELTHKAGGEMNIVVREKGDMAVVAEKTFMDTTYPSGKFGMYTKSQVNACFSGFTVSCV